MLDCAHGRWDIPVAGDEDNRWVISVGNLLLEIEAVDVRQFYVKDKARGEVRLIGSHIFAGRTVGDSAYSMRLQQLAQRLPDTLIVIHDEDNMIIRHHDAVSASTGNSKINIVPFGSFFSVQKWSAVRLDNRAANGEPHVHPMRFRRKEMLEYLGRKFDAAAAITDLGLDRHCFHDLLLPLGRASSRGAGFQRSTSTT